MTTKSSKELIATAQSEGVKDLPLKVRAPFARAILAEQRGDHDEAERQLQLAVEAEARD